MNAPSELSRSQRGAGARMGRCIAGWLIGSSLWLGGCADHRISINEFLETQQQVAAPAPAAQPAGQEKLDALLGRQLGPYRVGTGDVVDVKLFGASEAGLVPPVQVRVDRNGEIRLPIVGAVKVADLELQDVEEAVRGKYVPDVFKDASVLVSLVAADVTNVLVVGAVTTPGLVPLRRTERNMLFAIVLAGGVSELASGHATLRRIRQPGRETVVNLMDPAGVRAALELEPLENGDIVAVQAATPNQIFVGGLVLGSRPQIYPQGVKMTVLQAIAAAGGLRTDVFPREATLIRRNADGQDVHVKLNLDRITTGRDPNLVLAAGDILWVPDTIETRVQDWINRNIYLRAGMSVNYSVSGVEYMNRASQQSGGGNGGSGLQDSFDPFGFLGQNSALQSLTARPVATP